MTVWHRDFAISEAFPLSPGHILRNAATFLLGKTGHNGDQQLSLGVQGVDVFFLEVDLHTFFLQFTDGGKAVHGISGETADALCDN